MSADAAFRLANAVSIADRGVRLAHATGADVSVSRCGVSEQPATTNDIVAMAIQATMVRKLGTSGNEGNGGNYEDAGCQHQDFGKVKAREYWYFRHGYFRQVPDTDDRKPPDRGETVMREPKRDESRLLAKTLYLRIPLAACPAERNRGVPNI